MMQIALLAILFFAVTECEISKAVKTDLKHRPSDDNFIKLSDSTSKGKNFTKYDKSNLRQRLRETTRKWPKVSRKLRKKSAARMTKLNQMQEGEQTTIIDLQDTDDTVYSEFLSAYSIKEQLKHIVKEIPGNVTVKVIGRTKQYLDIVLLQITSENNRYLRANDKKYAEDKPEKKIIFIVHGLSVMGIKQLSCMKMSSEFLTLVSYYVHYLDEFDIFLIPMANPDGYSATQPSIIWNKNLAPQSECIGVALDRNFDVAWNTKKSVSSCSQEYPGEKPFSESETRAIREIFYKYSHKIVAYLNVHAGTYDTGTFKGDAVLYPKGYTDSITDEDKFIDLKGEIDEAIRNASFQVYSVAVETLYNWYGKVAGSSVDYASTVYGIPYALELVMQLYDDDEHVVKDTKTYTDSALTEVWARVIDVIFKHILKSIHKDNDVY